MQSKLLILRKEKKMTQIGLAQVIGISAKSYRDKENGRLNFSQDEMFALANVFKKSIDDIFLPRKHQNGANWKMPQERTCVRAYYFTMI